MTGHGRRFVPDEATAFLLCGGLTPRAPLHMVERGLPEVDGGEV